MQIDCKKVESLIKKALAEDIGKGDITSRLCIPKGLKIKAGIIFKQQGIVCGLDIAKKVFRLVDKTTGFKTLFRDGANIRAGETVAKLSGPARSILTAERTALNFLGHLSGIATQTLRFVEKIRPYRVKILDTRKTLPNLRYLEKYAVRVGGGYNHRMGLYDQILIKDNHLLVAGYKKGWINPIPANVGVRFIEPFNYKPQAASLKDLIRDIKKKRPKGVKVEVEVENLREFKQALKAEPDIIMLDNMSLKDIKRAVEIRKLFNKQYAMPLLEASGNVSLRNVRRIANTGIDMISVGSLTHSAKSIDLSLKIK